MPNMETYKNEKGIWIRKYPNISKNCVYAYVIETSGWLTRSIKGNYKSRKSAFAAAISELKKMDLDNTEDVCISIKRFAKCSGFISI